MAKTGHDFFLYPGKDIKPYWNESFRPKPDNIYFLPSQNIPANLEFDLVLSQTRFSQYQILYPLAKRMGLNIVTLEHTSVMPWWSEDIKQKLRSMTGDIDIFISDNSRKDWGWNEENSEVIHHGINADLFCPSNIKTEQPHILSVNNDFKNRDALLGFTIFQKVTNGLPTRLVGETAGFSLPAKDVDELISFYQNATCLLSCTVLSPIPSVVTESMACGTPVVALNNCLLPKVIEHGVNGFLCSNENELRECCELLLSDPVLSAKMGEAARKTILEKFSLSRFVDEWNNVFERASNLVFKG